MYISNVSFMEILEHPRRLLFLFLQGIGERCFDEGMYEAARLLFKNIHNNAKLALCLVHLGQFREAVDAASKANAVNTWKQVMTEFCRLYQHVISNIMV